MVHLALHSDLNTYVKLYGLYWLYMDIFGYLRIYTVSFGQCVCLNLGRMLLILQKFSLLIIVSS